jgi:serine/threonine protein kinase
VECSVRAIHDLGVLHNDLMPRNILRNRETGQAMVIDFERAEVFGQQPVLGVISPNRKRKRALELEGSPAKQPRERCSAFTREMNRAALELLAFP